MSVQNLRNSDDVSSVKSKVKVWFQLTTNGVRCFNGPFVCCNTNSKSGTKDSSILSSIVHKIFDRELHYWTRTSA
jgi:hypothetical protein